MGMDWGKLASGAMSLGGNIMGSQAGAASSRADRGRSREAERRRKAAYDAMIARAQGLADNGEQQFLSETSSALPELEAARQNALSGNAEALQQGAGQMRVSLAQQGARGGQASTLLNRGTGQMATDTQRGIDQMALTEAENRRNLRTGLFERKAGTGYGGLMQQWGG